MAVSRQSWRQRQNWRERLTQTEGSAEAGLRLGFRSGLEASNAKHLETRGVPVLFETVKIPYIVPETRRHYTPDFELPRKPILIETKGKFETSDRAKHMMVKAQHPQLDLRFVFSRPHDPLYKGSATTYAEWCEKYGFKYAARVIPEAWIEEAKNWAGEPIAVSVIEGEKR